MKLLKIRGGTEEELNNKEYNIGIGISIGNRWFNVENITELTKWALSFTRDKVVIYVADSIHGINLEVRKRISYEKARKLAIDIGTNLIDDLKNNFVNEFTDDELSKIKYFHWEDLNNSSYKEKVDFLYSFYANNRAFKQEIHGLVEEYIANDKRSFSNDDIDRFGMYILEELPECLCRVPMEGIVYDAYAYPFDSRLTQLIEKIQKGLIFPEIKNSILDTEPKVFLEVR